jgi:hypothetical protein
MGGFEYVMLDDGEYIYHTSRNLLLEAKRVADEKEYPEDALLANNMIVLFSHYFSAKEKGNTELVEKLRGKLIEHYNVSEESLNDIHHASEVITRFIAKTNDNFRVDEKKVARQKIHPSFGDFSSYERFVLNRTLMNMGVVHIENNEWTKIGNLYGFLKHRAIMLSYCRRYVQPGRGVYIYNRRAPTNPTTLALPVEIDASARYLATNWSDAFNCASELIEHRSVLYNACFQAMLTVYGDGAYFIQKNDMTLFCILAATEPKDRNDVATQFKLIFDYDADENAGTVSMSLPTQLGNQPITNHMSKWVKIVPFIPYVTNDDIADKKIRFAIDL